MFQQLENENLCQNPPNKPIDIAPMIWYDKCMLIPYKDSSDKFVTKKKWHGEHCKHYHLCYKTDSSPIAL